MARLTPTVQGETLTWYVDTHEQQLAVGTPAWYSWLQEASLFAFVGESGSFTARKETKPQGAPYWRAYRKRGGRLYHTYLGKSEQLTLERLNASAVRLARRAEGEETPSAQEFAQERLPESTPHDIPVVTRPASCSTRRCFMTPKRVMGSRCSSALSVCPSRLNRASSSRRRVGSASARKTASTCSSIRDHLVTCQGELGKAGAARFWPVPRRASRTIFAPAWKRPRSTTRRRRTG